MRAHICVTSSLNMASILSLPDECLHMIFSCIDGPSSFYNIASSQQIWFLIDSVCLVASKVFLTYEKVVDVWQRNGPMVAKLFTWVTIQETSVRNCFRGLLTAKSSKVRTVAFHLLGCCETLVIKSSYSVSSGGWLNYESARKYKGLRIQVWSRETHKLHVLGRGKT